MLPRWCSGKESACHCRRHKRHVFSPSVGKIPWSWEWWPTPVFLSGKFHGQRSLVGYSPWGCKELDMTEQFHFLSFLLRWHLELKSIILSQRFSLFMRGICTTLWWQMGIDGTSHTENNGTLDFSLYIDPVKVCLICEILSHALITCALLCNHDTFQ